MRRSSRGFMILDAIMGTAILGIIVLVLAIGLTREHRAAEGLSETRRAARAAEAALAQLQAGRPLPADWERAAIQVHDLTAAATPSGYHWVEVHATAGEQHETLIGLVPSAPAERGTP